MWRSDEPFCLNYMNKAILSTAIGAICAFLSAYLMLKGWSLSAMLSHAVVPGAIAYAFSHSCGRLLGFSGYFHSLD